MADIEDPFDRHDPATLRPRPGAGRPGSDDAARARPAESVIADAGPIPEAARHLMGIGLNPLVQAATRLLLLAGQLRGSLTPIDIAGLRRHALDEIREFEERARSAGIQHEIVRPANYVLCAGLDEAVLSTPWGAQSEWAQHPLLVALHSEAWGGERFFDVLDRISLDPARYIDLMELQYLNLAFGFAGKYRVQDRGHERLAEVQQDLYRKIRNHRGPPDSELSAQWRGLEDRRNPLIRYVPWWVVGAASLAIVSLTFTAYYTRLATLATPVHAELAQIGNEPAPPVEVPPSKGPTLKQLLAPDEETGAVRVDEAQEGRTVITLVARNLFASGSATVNPTYHETLRRVGLALNQVPGRVVVNGHTDAQPITSFRYANNFELSRARAISVSDVMRLVMDVPSRVSVNGLGSSRPLGPESTLDDRARNRRVEIIHVRGT